MFKRLGYRIPVFENEGTGGGNPPPPPAPPPPASPPPAPPPPAPPPPAPPPQTPPPAPAAPWSGTDVWKVGDQPWYATITEPEARAHIEAKGYKNPAELALANYSLTKMQRGDPTVVGLPGANATPEEWGAFYDKIGRPKSATEYEIKTPEGVQVDAKMLDFAKPAFHEAGLTPKQAQIIADKWNAFAVAETAALAEADTRANAEAITALETRWGGDLDKNKEAGRRVVQALGLPTSLIEGVENAIGSAAVVELLAMIGRKSDEGGFKIGGGGDPNDVSNLTPAQAQAKIDALRSDPAFTAKYNDARHPQHKDAVEELNKLYARV